MARDKAITEPSKKPNPAADPTGRDIMARQFTAALVDPTGREVIARTVLRQSRSSIVRGPVKSHSD